MRHIYRRALTRLAIGIPVFLLLVNPTSGPTPTPDITSHAFNDVSSTWSGITVHTNGTAVHAQWVEPPVKCGAGTTYGAIWVGIDGDGSNTVEQTGTQESCDHGRLWADGWYEMYPGPAHGLPGVRIVKPGDNMTASVIYESSGLFSLQLRNLSRRWTATERLPAPNAARLSVEVIIETPKSTTPNLNHFGTVTFTNVAVNHQKLGHWARAMSRYNLRSGNGQVEDTTSTPATSSFSIKWDS